jgi:hypothetical protein
MPKVNCESGGDPWKDGVGKGRKPNFAPSNQSLNLGAMNPTGDIDQVMRHDNGKLQGDETRKESDHLGLRRLLNIR